MAGSESSDGADQLPKKSEGRPTTIKIHTKRSRRQLTLIAITLLLNVLLWTSIICFIIAIYQFASDAKDTNSIPSKVLTLTSSLATVAYILFHTLFALKQRIWKHQGRLASIQKTSYIAVRFAVTLCILWLLTSGWNMIIVARRPACLPEASGLQGWEAGPICSVDRVGMAFSIIALMASCTLFWMLSIVRCPFEAHLLKHGYRSSSKPNLNPAVSRKPSPKRIIFPNSEEYLRGGSVYASTHRSKRSTTSNADIATLDLDSSTPATTIHAPSPMRSIGLGIFTSNSQPPPLPAAFASRSHPRASSQTTLPPQIFHPSASVQHPPLSPLRVSALLPPSGFVPLAVPTQFSASAWRAVHPPAQHQHQGRSPLGRAHLRSQSHLPGTNTNNFPYRTHYSRSSVSLTRPHRLSITTPSASVTCTSRSGSTGPEEGGRDSLSLSSGGASGSGGQGRPTANQIAYAILNGIRVPELDSRNGNGGVKVGRPAVRHARHVSALDATLGAQQSIRRGRGWKPLLEVQVEGVGNQLIKISNQSQNLQGRHGDRTPTTSTTANIPPSSNLLSSKFSPDSSVNSDKTTINPNLSPRLSFEKAFDLHRGSGIEQSTTGSIVRRIRSEDPIRISELAKGKAKAGVGRATTIVRRVPVPGVEGVRGLKSGRGGSAGNR